MHDNIDTSDDMDIAIHLLVNFGEAYSFGVEEGEDDDNGTFSVTTHALIELITGKEPSRYEIDFVFPIDAHAEELADIAISQTTEPPSASEISTAQALLIEFGVSYWFASRAKRYDPHGYLMTSTKVLIYLLTGKKALPEHVEQVAPHDQALSDA